MLRYICRVEALLAPAVVLTSLVFLISAVGGIANQCQEYNLSWIGYFANASLR